MNLREAAEKVLRECLRIKPADRTLILFDHYGLPLTEAFLEVSSCLPRLGMSARLIPVRSQEHLAARGTLTPSIRSDLAAADALIFAVTDARECTAFRASVLNLAHANNIRILHMPGVDEDLFLRATKDVDFRVLQKRASGLARRLLGKKIITISTVDSKGGEHKIDLHLEGRSPHVCGGVSKPGEIMNFPTGEVYLAPIENISTGEVVLNGSTENAVFRWPEEIILSFRDGVLDLELSSFPTRPTSERFRNHLHTVLKDDPRGLVLCEIGIGLNECVETLTGSEIWDEKAAGTIHIAIGANKPFGGKIATNHHRDLIFFPKEVRIDGRVLNVEWRDPRPEFSGGRRGDEKEALS